MGPNLKGCCLAGGGMRGEGDCLGGRKQTSSLGA